MKAAAILIVDDEESLLFAMGEYFGGLGFHVDCAREREEAEALLAHRTYGLVIADLRLTGFGGAEGLEIASFIRERDPRTPIVLLTGHLTAEVEQEGRRRGADVLLQKPQSLAELARIASSLLGAAA